MLKVWFFNSSNAGIGGVHRYPLFGQTSIDLFSLLNGNPLTNGTWLDLDSSGLINNGNFDASMVSSPSVFRVAYRQIEPNYPADTAILELRFFDPNGLFAAKKKSLKIFPNPSPGVIHFQIPENESIRIVQLLDHSGKLPKAYAKLESHRLDLSGLPPGIYLLSFLGRDRYNEKLVIK